jgi:ketosteroid isomerase-like protein
MVLVLLQSYLPGIRACGGSMSKNIDNTRKAYAAFGAGDIPTLLELIAPDCVWHVGGKSPVAGTYTGHDQIVGYFGQLLELSGGTFKAELVDLAELPATGLVAALVRTTAAVDGQTSEIRMVELGRSNDAGQLVECWWFSEDQYAQDAVFAPQEIVLPSQSGQPVRA